MAKSRRKQKICNRKLEKAKKQRKQKTQFAKVKAEVEMHLAEADRLMEEAESLFKYAVIKRIEQPQPSFNISASFTMRMLYEALQNDAGFNSAFRDLPEHWCPPFTKTTRYRDLQYRFAQRWLYYNQICSWKQTYSATLELYRSLIGSKEDRILCNECACFDWRYHLAGFEDRSPIDRGYFGDEKSKGDTGKITRSDFGGEYKITDSGTSFTLPSLAHALENEISCTLCSLLVSALKATATLEQFEHIARDAQPIEISCYSPFKNDLQDYWVLYTRFFSDQKAAVGTWDVITIRFTLHTTRDSLTWDPMVRMTLQDVGRDIIPSTQIDLSVIRSWWQKCKTEHSECRKKAKALSFNHTSARTVFRVIDVERNEVVIAPKACSYIALSYVWGGITAYQSKTFRKTSDVLTGDEIIPITRRRVPKTIRDAMRVTKLIGERYLWVDALCIVQDDDLEKAMTICQMNNIYQNSLLTIVAADGRDANSGLVGLEAGSRLIRSVVGCVDSIYLTIAEPAPELNNSPWSSRAWTYQEEQFSQRLLIFAHNRVYYKCSKGSFGEARPLKQLRDSILSTNLEPKLVNISEEEDQVLYAYTKHVEAYTSRNLTYEGDILHAFEGLMSHISSTSKNDFVFFWGLPTKDLIYALAWKSESSHLCMRRRSATTRYWGGVTYLYDNQHPMPITSSIEFPSWCWAGWVGPVRYDIFEYPRLSCWNSHENCFFSSTVEYLSLSDKQDTTRKEEAVVSILSLGILSLSADMASLDHERIKGYEKHCADDDSCEMCRGQTQFHSRTLVMDDGSVWESGMKEGILLLNAVGFIDDFCSHTVLLIRRDAENGIYYREGIIDLQKREWEAANPSRKDLRLG